jgi:hypothetical protein
MLWGAALGWVIISAVGYLRETESHKGPGVVQYGDGERGPEWSERVSEEKYKRHNYTQFGLLLGVGLLFWFIIAKGEKVSAVEAKAKEDYLEARLEERIAYLHAFASQLDQASRARASERALSEPEYQAARKAAETQSRAHSAALKALRGGE